MPPFSKSQTRHGLQPGLDWGRLLFWRAHRQQCVFLHWQDITPPTNHPAQEKHQTDDADRDVGHQTSSPEGNPECGDQWPDGWRGHGNRFRNLRLSLFRCHMLPPRAWSTANNVDHEKHDNPDDVDEMP